MSAEKENEILDTKEAAKLLHLTVQMVRMAAREGKIKGYHPYEGSPKFIFKRSELLAGMVPAEE